MSAEKPRLYKLRQVWNEQTRMFEFLIYFGKTTYVRSRYKLHAQTVCAAWNKRLLAKAVEA